MRHLPLAREELADDLVDRRVRNPEVDHRAEARQHLQHLPEAVARDRLSDVLEALPRLGPLVDLSVADAEVEGIVRDLFTRDAPVMEGAS
jgi:hypothetical protein